MGTTAPRRIAITIEYAMPPFEPRTMKHCAALAGAGHDVHLLVGGPADAPRTERINDVTVHRARFPRSSIVRKLLNEIRRVTFRHPLWVRELRLLLENIEPHQLHVHDLPLMASAISANRCARLPLLFDMHENYPAAIRIWNPMVGPWKRLVTERYARLLRHEGQACRSAGHITVVIDEMRERLLSQHGLSSDRVTVVSNTDWCRYPERAHSLPASLRRMIGARVLLSYVGHFGPHRGIEVAIEAMSRLPQPTPACVLLLAGGPRQLEDRYRELADRFGVSDCVVFAGWQPEEMLPALIAASDVGVIPHRANEHTDHTIPNKLFHYMMCGRPVIVSSCRPLARITRSSRCGLVFESGSAGGLAGEITRLVSNAELRKTLGDHGRRATLDGRWNWETDSAILLGVVARLSASRDG